MKSERIGLRFSKKDEDIISWFLMLKENKIEQSFAVKALLKAFFLNEQINGGTVKIRNNPLMEPTSISINESYFNDDIMKIKSQGIKLASFTKEIIRSYISVGNEDLIPNFSELQRIHTRYKLKYLNNIFHNDIMEIAVTRNDKFNFHKDDEFKDSNNVINHESNEQIVSEQKPYLEDSNLNNRVSIDNINTLSNNMDILEDKKEVEEKKNVKPKKRNPLLAQI